MDLILFQFYRSYYFVHFYEGILIDQPIAVVIYTLDICHDTIQPTFPKPLSVYLGSFLQPNLLLTTQNPLPLVASRTYRVSKFLKI